LDWFAVRRRCLFVVEKAWLGRKKDPSKGKNSPLWIENSSPFRGVEKIPGMGSRICP